ncbi:hypothetical protein MMC31_005921 [Peltigera leucophlebia]|nr:hypothetical protein [Peltigera leucophlebia]
MEVLSFLWQVLAFVIMATLKKTANVADEVMFTFEDYEVYGNTVKFFSSCVGNFYFWQSVATIGFYQYLRWLALEFPPRIVAIGVGPVHVGPNMQQLPEIKETALKDAVSQNDDLDKENAGLRAKVERLEKEVDFISKDRYALVRENCILQNKLGDFNSWPEFRVEYDQLSTEFVAMKRQRAREHISSEQILYIAKQARAELAAAKRAEGLSIIAHSDELRQIQHERDEAKEKYQNLLATTTAAAATTAITTMTATAATSAVTIASAEVKTPGDKALQEENIRLTLALRSQTSQFSKKSSDLDRLKSLLKTRSNHSAAQLGTAASTILSLEEEKRKAEERIAELEKDVQEANEKAEEMEEMYMAVVSMDEGEGEKEEEEKEEEEKEEEEKENEEKGEDGEGRPETSWLLKQVVAMSKKKPNEEEATSGESRAIEDRSEDQDKDDDEDDDKEEEEKAEDQEEEEKKIHDENEDLFNDMMGSQ